MKARVAAGVFLALAACDRSPASALNRSGSPIARAADGATASVVLIACPQTLAGGALVQEVINAAMAGGELVVAGTGGTARVVIDTCPTGVRQQPRATAPRAR